MIDLLRTWLPQIIGTAEELQNGNLERTWTGRERSTSAYYSGELFEQIFGDLRSDSMLEEAHLTLHQHPPLVSSLEAFLRSLKLLDAWIEEHVDTRTWGLGKDIPLEVHNIFHSNEWQVAQADAATLVLAAAGAGFSSNNFGPLGPAH